MKIAFIGGGNMAAALIGGLIRKGVPADNLYAIDPNEDARKRSAEQFGVRNGAAADAALASYDAVLIAVKPQSAKAVAEGIAPHLSAHQVVISIMAGIRIDDLSRWLNGHARVVRTMPNTPALIGMGATGGVAALPLTQAGLEVIGLEAGTLLSPSDFAPDELRNNYRGWPQLVQNANHEVPTHRRREGAPYSRHRDESPVHRKAPARARR